jgi:hypothetical protein
MKVIRTHKINFKSKNFLKGLDKVRKENERIDQYSKNDVLKMFERFDI